MINGVFQFVPEAELSGTKFWKHQSRNSHGQSHQSQRPIGCWNMRILVKAESMCVAKPSSRGVTVLSMCVTVARGHSTDSKILVD